MRTSSKVIGSQGGAHSRFAGISGVLSHWPQKPILTPESHLDAVQISTITPIITVLHFLVLTAASQGHVLLTSSSSSWRHSSQVLGAQEVTLKENRCTQQSTKEGLRMKRAGVAKPLAISLPPHAHLSKHIRHLRGHFTAYSRILQA